MLIIQHWAGGVGDRPTVSTTRLWVIDGVKGLILINYKLLDNGILF